MIAFTHRGVILGEQALVADGLRLGVLNSHVAALAFVAVENFLALFAAAASAFVAMGLSGQVPLWTAALFAFLLAYMVIVAHADIKRY